MLGCSGLAWLPGQVGEAGYVPAGGRSRPERSNRAEVLPGAGKESQTSPGGRTLMFSESMEVEGQQSVP